MKKIPKHLPHVDGLRALAVTAVIVYHYFEQWLPSGYLGVDLFFVISGFVITGYLRRTNDSSWPSLLSEFYVRRLKRLLPALLFCVLLTSFAIIMLTIRPSETLFQTGATALLGFSNIFLFSQSSDYFSLDSSLNAFTHTWSLGVEEQFYLFYPLLFLILGLSLKKQGKNDKSASFWLIFLTLLSFIAFVTLNSSTPMAAFYLLPTRIWELNIGILSYLALERQWCCRIKGNSELSLSLMVTALFLPLEYKVFATTLLVSSTALFLTSLPNQGLIYNFFSRKPVVTVGLLSYSLYLWHWPILILGRHTLGDHGIALLVLIFLMISISLFSYYVIERPLRYAKWWPSNIGTFILGITIILIAAPLTWNSHTYKNPYKNLLPSALNIPAVVSWVDDVDCHGRQDLAQYNDPLSACLSANRSKDKPNALYLLGDSHAAQLHFMFDEALQESPYVFKFINNLDFPTHLLKKEGQSTTLDYVIKDAKKGDILAIAFHRGHLNPIRDKHLEPSKSVSINSKERLLFKNFSKQFSQLKNRGVNLLLIRDTPLMKIVATSPSCLVQIKLFGTSACQISRQQDLHTRIRQDRFYNALADHFSATCLWDPLDELYRGQPTLDVENREGDGYLMWDWNHISKATSKQLAPAFLKHFKSCFR